jgi:hypothetical protein
LARLHLRYADSPQYAERVLAAALQGAAGQEPKADEIWRSTAGSLLVAALARNGKTVEAQAMINQLAGAPPEMLLESLATIDGLITQEASADGAARRELGRLAAAIVRLLDARRDELSESAMASLERYRAAASMAVGDRAAALAHYGALAAQTPDDGEIQERYARLLAASDSPEELQRALAAWKQVESRSRRGGDRWWRARKARIELLRRLGDAAEAEKLVRLTRLLYPDRDTAAAK